MADDDFELELKRDFLVEVKGLLENIEPRFLELEHSPEDPALIDEIFRVAHNIKGSSKAVGFTEVGDFTHEFESFLLRIKKKELQLTSREVDVLLRCNDHLRTWFDELTGDLSAQRDSTALITELKGWVADGGAAAEAAPTVEAAPVVEAAPELPTIDGVQIPPASAFDNPDQQEAPAVAASETPAASAAPAPTPAPAPAAAAPAPAAAAAAAPAAAKKSAAPVEEESLRVNLKRLDTLINYVGELVILETVLREQAMASSSLLLKKTISQLDKVTKEIQDISMGLRMIPLKQTFSKMQRIVRDTSKALGKNILLEIEGAETEIDKTVLEELSDPLVHIIRNAIDHGVETPEVRVAAGKPPQATVWLRAFQKAGKMVIEVKDDGNGIDTEKVKSIAVKKGLVSANAVLSKQEMIQLIFKPGFSTKAVVTDVSGRGVGMDVVKTNIEKLKGEIRVDTDLGKGSCFQLILPLSLAIIDAMIVQVGTERFIISLSQVHQSLQASKAEIHNLNGIGNVVHLRGENLPLYPLKEHLKLTAAAKTSIDEQAILVIRTNDQPFAVLVDQILGQYQVVIKQVGADLRHISGISGSAILGDGRPALILELPELVKGFSKNCRRSSRMGVEGNHEASLQAGTAARYMCFSLGEEEFAIQLLSVKEVIGLPEITSVPQSPAHHLGIINLRGQIISIIDLRLRLGFKTKNGPETSVIIFDFGDITIGVVVDSVNSVIEVARDSIMPGPTSEGRKNQEYISGVMKIKDHLVLLVEIDRILHIDEIRKLSKATA